MYAVVLLALAAAHRFRRTGLYAVAGLSGPDRNGRHHLVHRADVGLRHADRRRSAGD